MSTGKSKPDIEEMTCEDLKDLLVSIKLMSEAEAAELESKPATMHGCIALPALIFTGFY